MALSPIRSHSNRYGRELVNHGTPQFPAACYHGDPSVNPIPWHWHEEIEFLICVRGYLVVHVASELVYLSEGEGIFINSETIHAIGPKFCEGEFISIVFHPRLLIGAPDSYFSQKLIKPIIEDKQLDFIHLTHRRFIANVGNVRIIAEEWGGKLQHLAPPERKVESILNASLTNKAKQAVEQAAKDQAAKDQAAKEQTWRHQAAAKQTQSKATSTAKQAPAEEYALSPDLSTTSQAQQERQNLPDLTKSANAQAHSRTASALYAAQTPGDFVYAEQRPIYDQGNQSSSPKADSHDDDLDAYTPELYRRQYPHQLTPVESALASRTGKTALVYADTEVYFSTDFESEHARGYFDAESQAEAQVERYQAFAYDLDQDSSKASLDVETPGCSRHDLRANGSTSPSATSLSPTASLTLATQHPNQLVHQSLTPTQLNTQSTKEAGKQKATSPHRATAGFGSTSSANHSRKLGYPFHAKPAAPTQLTLHPKFHNVHNYVPDAHFPLSGQARLKQSFLASHQQQATGQEFPVTSQQAHSTSPQIQSTSPQTQTTQQAHHPASEIASSSTQANAVPDSTPGSSSQLRNRSNSLYSPNHQYTNNNQTNSWNYVDSEDFSACFNAGEPEYMRHPNPPSKSPYTYVHGQAVVKTSHYVGSSAIAAAQAAAAYPTKLTPTRTYESEEQAEQAQATYAATNSPIQEWEASARQRKTLEQASSQVSNQAHNQDSQASSQAHDQAFSQVRPRASQRPFLPDAQTASLPQQGLAVTNPFTSVLSPDATGSYWKSTILNSVRRAWQVVVDESFGYKNECRFNLTMALELLVQHLHFVDRARGHHQDDLFAKRIKLMVNYIEKNFDTDIKLVDIAKAANISDSQCSRTFQKVMNTTPIQYLKELRLTKAAERIANTKEKISIIAAEVGFSDMSYFSKAFRESRGFTPKEYRERAVEKFNRQRQSAKALTNAKPLSKKASNRLA